MIERTLTLTEENTMTLYQEKNERFDRFMKNITIRANSNYGCTLSRDNEVLVDFGFDYMPSPYSFRSSVAKILANELWIPEIFISKIIRIMETQVTCRMVLDHIAA
jgi:hypothetical protein